MLRTPLVPTPSPPLRPTNSTACDTERRSASEIPPVKCFRTFCLSSHDIIGTMKNYALPHPTGTLDRNRCHHFVPRSGRRRPDQPVFSRRENKRSLVVDRSRWASLHFEGRDHGHH